MCIETVLSTNNKGVELLYSGRYRAAKKAFRNALLQLKAISRNSASCSNFKFQFSLLVESLLIPYKTQNRNFLYRKALLANLDTKSTRESPNTDDDDQPILPSAVITYNLSLAHHFLIMGCDKVKSCRIRLKQVLANYEKALQAINLQLLCGRTHFTEQHFLRDATFLGILNNVGLLNYEFGDYSQAKFCFDTLKTLMNSASRRVLGEEAHRGISLNAWLLEEPNTAQAA